MLKLLIQKAVLLSILSVSVFANISITKVKYEGGISLFGKVAEADIVLEEDLNKSTYKMIITASSIGVVKALTSNREDIFISEGKVKDGVYIPYKFTKIVTKNDYIKKTIYTFDYKSSQVLKETHKEEMVDDSSYDIIKLELISKQKLVKSNDSEYIKLRKNDYVSMFLNLSVNNLENGAIGYIDQKDSDDVMLISKTMFEVSKHDGDELYRISFSKDESMFFEKAVAIDIAFYGDAYLQKISEEKIKN
ncbi:MAG: hypothetical protein U9N02_09070 [Campylobacterota bacterium]|nr:hypothetical protein [Campylobacterota bacterium]